MNQRLIVMCISLTLGLEIFSIRHALANVNDFACGSLANAYGPYDYRSDKNKLPIVEGAHLTPEIVNLVGGKSGTFLGGNIDYTLRAFPNHPYALMAMVKLGEKEKRSKPKGARYSVECYLYRANRFRGDDSMVKMIYAIYLAKKERSSDALKYLNEALELGGENANLYYNMGLIYFDLKQYDKALSNAHRAYRLGFPLPGLRDRLKRAGKWSDQETVTESRPIPDKTDDGEVNVSRPPVPVDRVAPPGN